MYPYEEEITRRCTGRQFRCAPLSPVSFVDNCRCLYVIVPFKEDPLYHEHVNYYEEDYYRDFNVSMIKTFTVLYERTLTLRERAKRVLKGSLKFHDPVAKNMILYKINGDLA